MTVRKFGLILLLLGVFGFFYASSRASEAGPVPEGLSLSQSIDHPAGRWEMARYAAVGAAALGILLALFPQGR